MCPPKMDGFGQNLAEGSGMQKSDTVKFFARLLQRPGEGAKKVFVTDTMHRFSHFCLTDLDVWWNASAAVFNCGFVSWVSK